MHEKLDFYSASGKLDFVLVFPPVVSQWSLVSGYFRAFQEAISELSREHWHDQVLFERYQNYYEKLAALLHPGVPAASLTPGSRHRFYVTKGISQSGDASVMHLSGLERLLGYEEMTTSDVAGQNTSEVVGTGQPDLDAIASLIRLEVKDLEWLCANYSVVALASVAEYLWECKAAAAGKVTEAQHQKDRDTWDKVRQVQGNEMDAAADEALSWLVNRTGEKAVELNVLRQQEDGEN
jgi:hypothetical protein